jgi:hypothetical protein
MGQAEVTGLYLLERCDWSLVACLCELSTDLYFASSYSLYTD